MVVGTIGFSEPDGERGRAGERLTERADGPLPGAGRGWGCCGGVAAQS